MLAYPLFFSLGIEPDNLDAFRTEFIGPPIAHFAISFSGIKKAKKGLRNISDIPLKHCQSHQTFLFGKWHVIKTGKFKPILKQSERFNVLALC